MPAALGDMDPIAGLDQRRYLCEERGRPDEPAVQQDERITLTGHLMPHAQPSRLLANGHLSLAVSLAQDIAVPFMRADRLAEIALALLDSNTPQDAAPLVREVETALDETRNTPPPTVLAAFARTAGTAGRADLTTSALELAFRRAH
ncbi:hypothetical protein [Streptomyces sp. NPDC005507]|uniref:hypothetical protein n=2 Tax=unclassified Streptomyces TaxID=2593676 RepID=UPI0033AC9095